MSGTFVYCVIRDLCDYGQVLTQTVCTVIDVAGMALSNMEWFVNMLLIYDRCICDQSPIVGRGRRISEGTLQAEFQRLTILRDDLEATNNTLAAQYEGLLQQIANKVCNCTFICIAYQIVGF